jgi:hypothetical protein
VVQVYPAARVLGRLVIGRPTDDELSRKLAGEPASASSRLVERERLLNSLGIETGDGDGVVVGGELDLVISPRRTY